MIDSRITKLIAIVLLGAMSTSMLFSQFDVIYDTPAPVTAMEKETPKATWPTAAVASPATYLDF